MIIAKTFVILLMTYHGGVMEYNTILERSYSQYVELDECKAMAKIINDTLIPAALPETPVAFCIPKRFGTAE
jgi:hypothetical protein